MKPSDRTPEMEVSKGTPVISTELLANLRKLSFVVQSKLPTPERKTRSKLEEIKNCSLFESDDSESLLCFPLGFNMKGFNIPKEQKVDYHLDVARIKPPNLRTQSSEVWCPRTITEQSSWDNFFESQTELTDSYKIHKVATEDSWEWSASINETPQATSEMRNSSFYTAPKKNHVFVSYVTKTGMRWDHKDLSMRIEELAEWLNEDFKSESQIPISQNISVGSKNFRRGKKFRKQTIAEAVGDLDPSKEGLTFFIGPVNGKLCFKMSVCDLHQIRELLSPMLHKTKDINKVIIDCE